MRHWIYGDTTSSREVRAIGLVFFGLVAFSVGSTIALAVVGHRNSARFAQECAVLGGRVERLDRAACISADGRILRTWRQFVEKGTSE